MSGSKMGRMMRQVRSTAQKLIVPFGRIATSTYLRANIKNVADSEAREIRVITPFGVSSCPLPELFAQIIFNDHINNTCPGIWNDKAPEAKPGETILYNKDNKVQIKLSKENSLKMWNQVGSIEIKADGTIIIKNGGGTITMSSGGAISMNCSTFTVNSSGAVKINGSTIDLN